MVLDLDISQSEYFGSQELTAENFHGAFNVTEELLYTVKLLKSGESSKP